MLTQNAEKLLKQRYYLPGETWEKLVERNVKNIAQENHQEYYTLIHDLVFLPNSPSLVNAGKKTGGLMACFVRNPEDTLEDSFEALKDIAMVAKAGGGCGFTGSLLRPKNSPVAGSTHGYAYGPNRFAELVSYGMDAITQSGFRKMALMYTLSGEHPDAEDFIYLKQKGDDSSCYNFNQSLMVTDSWVNRAINNPTGREGKLFDLLAKHAWSNGDPGLIFEDTINKSPYAETGQKIICTNPCSEQGLPSYGSCNLGSINLNHEIFNSRGSFDFGKLEYVTRKVTRYLDWTGSVNKFPNQKFAAWYEKNRPIGTGVMGLADLFLRYKITYGKSLDLLERIMECMYFSALHESIKMGMLNGIPEECEKLSLPRRNITLLSIAPTGSISNIAGCNYGIEPIFSPSYVRIDERGEEYLYTHPDSDKEYFVSAVGSKQPTWKEQIDLVATAQRWVDSGISKTINLPNSATVDDIKQAMLYAWQTRCKGITVYRDNSREFQILNQVKDPSCKSGVCVL